MEVLSRYSADSFMGYIPEIRKDPKAWWIIEIAVGKKPRHNAAYVAYKVREQFEGRQGIIFICGGTDILALAYLGREVTGESVATGLNEKLAVDGCKAHVVEASGEGLAKLQLRLESSANDDGQKESELLGLRKGRKVRSIMVVDDDALVRSLLHKNFQQRGKISEFKDTRNVLVSYLENLPDMVFLDIHLPGGSGMTLLKEILQFDETAFVIILSADAAAENVVEAKRLGAKGFVAKPFTIDKLEACYKKCPTLN